MYIVPIGGSMLTLSQIEVNSMFFCGIRVSFSVLCFADIVCLFLFVVVLSILLFWLVITPFCLSLYCLSCCFGLWLPLSVCRCIVYPVVLACDYPFLFVIVLSILLFWLVITPFCLSLHCLSFCFGLWLPLSVCRCIVYPVVLACDYPFLFVIVLSILLFWLVITPFCLSLHCLSFCFGLWLPLSVCRCIVYPSVLACDYPFLFVVAALSILLLSILLFWLVITPFCLSLPHCLSCCFGLWLPLSVCRCIVYPSVLACDYPFLFVVAALSILLFWLVITPFCLSLHCLSFCFGLWLPLSVCRCIVYPSVLACDYPFLFVVVLSILLFWLVITPFCLSLYCLSCCFGLWLPLSVCHCIVYPVVLACDYPFLFVVALSILLFWLVITPFCLSLYCLSCCFGLWLPLSVCHCIVYPVVLACDYPFLFVVALSILLFWLVITPFCLSLYCLSCCFGLWLPRSVCRCRIVYPVVLACDYPFLFVVALSILLFWLVITPFCLSLHCLSCCFGLWLPLSVCRCRIVYPSVLACDYPFLFVVALSILLFWLVITPFCLSLYCLSFCFGLWLPLSVCRCRIVYPVVLACDYPFLFVVALSILLFWLVITPFCLSLHCLSCCFGLWLPLSVCHCIVYPSVLACDYPFLFVVVLSILLFWLVITPFCLSLYCLSCCFGLWLPLSVCRCIVYPVVLACDYPFLFVVVLSILLFWLVITPVCLSLYCLSFCFGLWLPLSVCRCIVYPSVLACDYPFLFVVALSILLFWLVITPFCLSLYCLSFCFGLWLPLSVCRCRIVYPSVLACDYPFLFVVALSILLFWLVITPFCLSLYCLSFCFGLWLPLSVCRCIVYPVVLACDYPFLFVVVLSILLFWLVITPFCLSLYCLSCCFGLWLPLWYFQTFLTKRHF